MKKHVLLFTVIVLCASLLTGCCLSHEWEDASCTEPKNCEKCGEIEGEALGHEWAAATCEAPETCTRCGETQGKALEHQWQNATCTTPQICMICQKTEGEALGHTINNWQVNNEENQMTAQCSVCYASDVQEIDRKVIAEARLVGTWDSDVVNYNGSEYPIAGLHYVFYEDHTYSNWYDESPNDIYTGTWEFSKYEWYEASSPNIAPFDYYYILLTTDTGSYYVLLNCREDYYLFSLMESVSEDGDQWLFYDRVEPAAE